MGWCYDVDVMAVADKIQTSGSNEFITSLNL